MLGRGFSRDETAEQSQNDAKAYKNECGFGIERGADADVSNEAVENSVDDGDENVADADAKEPGQQADNEGLGIEDAGDIVFAGANGAEDADFFFTFVDGNVSNDANHEGTDDERDGDEGDEDVRDGVDDGADGVHEEAGHVGIGDFLVFVMLFVVFFDEVFEVFFTLKAGKIKPERRGFVGVLIAESLQVRLLVALGIRRDGRNYPGELVFGEVEREGVVHISLPHHGLLELGLVYSDEVGKAVVELALLLVKLGARKDVGVSIF